MIMAESFLNLIHTIFKSSRALLRQIMRRCSHQSKNDDKNEYDDT